MEKSLKDQSRINWTSSNENLTIEQIQTGAILRIADSLEKMEKPFLDQIKEIEKLKKSNSYLYDRLKEEEKAAENLQRKIAALKGHLTRHKNNKITTP